MRSGNGIKSFEYREFVDEKYKIGCQKGGTLRPGFEPGSLP